MDPPQKRFGSMIILHVYILALRSALSTLNSLEFVHLIVSISQLFQIPCKLTLLRGTLLRTRDRLIQPRWATYEDLNVLLLRPGNDLLQQVLRNEAFTLLPPFRRIIEDVERSEAIWVIILQLLELLLEKDILLRDVTEHERDFRLVLRVLEDGPRELPHGCYACAAGDDGDVAVFVGRPGVFRDGAFDVEGVAGFQGVYVFGHRSVGVFFDDEVEEAPRIYIACQSQLQYGNIEMS